MYLLFFDTETTGKPLDWKASVYNTSNWPRMVQIAWILADDTGKTLKTENRIIMPHGFSIPEEAAKVHGITTEIAMEEGVTLASVLDEVYFDILDADLLVGHNINFDYNVLGCEYVRVTDENPLDSVHGFCTMRNTTDFCEIPGPYGNKWPSLQELHNKLFGKDFEGAHDALADVKATADCYFELVRLGVF